MQVSSMLPSFARRLLPALLIAWPAWCLAIEFPGPKPGPARVRVEADRLVLENQVLSAEWRLVGGKLRPVAVVDKLSGAKIDLGGGECFTLVMLQSPSPQALRLSASQMRLANGPAIRQRLAMSSSPRPADRMGGQTIAAELVSPDGRVRVSWEALLRDGANSIEQQLILGTPEEVELGEVVLLEAKAPGASVAGVVEGCPVVADNFFFACAHPAASNEVVAGAQPGQEIVRCRYPAHCGIARGERLEFRSVIGVTPPGQLRRGFLYYLERERAQPYRPFLHHNNGFEVGCEYWRARLSKNPDNAARFVATQQQLWLDLIDAVGRELVQKRHVAVASFVHDHGWDDENLVWQFHAGYPQGFTPIRKAAEAYGSSAGVWFSPWGGYSGRAARIAGGQKQFLETYKMGLAMAGPRYEARLRTVCEEMIRRYDVNYFKFDGFGAGNNQPGAGPYRTEVEAMLRIIAELRRLKPDVFINATTGTWPSPFWLLWCDSIWRQGSDSGVTGKGSDRQQWITYRDGQIWHGTLERSPLYPMSSLMIHGLLVTKFPFKGNWLDPKAKVPTRDPVDLTAEIRSFFATGVNCQELYIQPKLMTAAMWDVLAEAALWSRANSDVLADTHWIGGDPEKHEVYGYASWSRRKGIVGLRNSDDQPHQFALDVGKVFELPEGAPRRYTLKSPWKAAAGSAPITATAGVPQMLDLKPLELVVLEATADER